MRDAIDDHVVAAWLGHPHVADLYELGVDARHVHALDALDQRRGERVLHSEKHTNLFHKKSVGNREPGAGIRMPKLTPVPAVSRFPVPGSRKIRRRHRTPIRPIMPGLVPDMKAVPDALGLEDRRELL